MRPIARAAQTAPAAHQRPIALVPFQPGLGVAAGSSVPTSPIVRLPGVEDALPPPPQGGTGTGADTGAGAGDLPALLFADFSPPPPVTVSRAALAAAEAEAEAAAQAAQFAAARAATLRAAAAAENNNNTRATPQEMDQADLDACADDLLSDMAKDGDTDFGSLSGMVDFLPLNPEPLNPFPTHAATDAENA